MKPVEFPEQNCIHRANGCADLPTLVMKNDKFDCDEVVSCWEMEDSDIQEMLKSLKENERPKIFLSILGGQPRVSIFVRDT